MRRALIAAVIAVTCGWSSARATDAAFTQFIASLWPEAQAEGVSRATFERETHGLEPDYKLPDLLLPGRPATGAPSQAEFVQVPADYVREASIARLAGEGQRLLQKYRPALTEIEKKSGVPATMMLAIWGRETDYGRYTLPYDLVRVLATQAYVGRRKDQYRTELILALKLLGEGVVTRKDMRSSWAGATGLTQFLPSEYYKHGVDFDGDGRIDLVNNPADVIGSVANYFKAFGWQPGVPAIYPVHFEEARLQKALLLAPDILPTFSADSFVAAGAVPEGDGINHKGLFALVELQNGLDMPPTYVAGTRNFYVITRYNWSSYYAMSVLDLGQEVKAAMEQQQQAAR